MLNPIVKHALIPLAVVLTMTNSSLVQATDIVFDLTGQTSPVTSFSLTNSGYTLTFSNPNIGNFQALGGNGIEFGGGIFPTVFNIQVSGGSLMFKNYEVGAIFFGGLNPFTLTGGTGTSTGNLLDSTGVKAFNGPYSISTTQTVVFTTSQTATSFANAQIKNMTFSTVPEPSTYALGAIATGVMAAVARRRKARRV